MMTPALVFGTLIGALPMKPSQRRIDALRRARGLGRGLNRFDYLPPLRAEIR